MNDGSSEGEGGAQEEHDDDPGERADDGDVPAAHLLGQVRNSLRRAERRHEETLDLLRGMARKRGAQRIPRSR